MQEASVLTGIVDRLLFQDIDNGFTVFLLQSGKDTVTATGHMPGLYAGQEVTLTGIWAFHKKFGKQFEVSSCTHTLPTQVTGLKKYLASGLIKGIGKSYAERLVNHFGTSILSIIDTAPTRLQEVAGIGEKRAASIAQAWCEQKHVAHLMVFLQEKGISASYAGKIHKKYREQALALIKLNPYRLANDITGIGFKTADEIAQKLGFALDSSQRIASGILHTIHQATNQGHLYVELTDLRQKTFALLELHETNHAQNVKAALQELYGQNHIVLLTVESVHYITVPSLYYAERGVAQKLHKLLSYPALSTYSLDTAYTVLRTVTSHLQLNEDQQRGIMIALKSKMTIITGGPGTGKTTLIKQLIELLELNHVRYKLAAPTGRAAKRMMEGTGRQAVTIHRLLEFDVSTMSFTHNESNALALDFLIIDEASMIDIFLAHAVLKALPLTAHLVLIGDTDQLPAVGAGNFLRDCLQSSVIQKIHLSQIFRQAQDSLIVVNAHRINQGEFPLSSVPGSRNDFIFIKEEEPQQLEKHLKRLLFIELAKRNFLAHEATILVPMNRGAAGTVQLNHLMQQLLNAAPQDQVMHAGTWYKVNDKVMQLRNNYEKLVFNGDIGTIHVIANEDREITVQFADRSIVYDFDELQELTLAYAITIHKSQGSEYPVVIVPLFMQHFTLLQRNLIYTALTRARQLCIFIGQPKAIGMAVRTVHALKRVTFLHHFLQHPEELA